MAAPAGTSDKRHVFVSYCHEDVAIAHKLRIHLGPRLPTGTSVWVDTQIRTGDRWHDEIGAAIDRSLLAVLLVSAEFIDSAYIMGKEVRRFIDLRIPMAGILVRSAPYDAVPELAQVQWAHHDIDRDGPVAINAHGIQATSAEIDDALGPLCQRIAARVAADHLAGMPTMSAGTQGTNVTAVADQPRSTSAGRLVNVPALPVGYVRRDRDLKRLRSQLLHAGPALGLTGDITVLGLHGQGGIGKTVLATALARDVDVRRHFPDGVYWITLGETPDLATALKTLVAKIDSHLARDLDVSGVLGAHSALQKALAPRQALIVVDDVWSDRAATSFRVAAPNSRVLYTTRDVRVLRAVGADVGRVDTLDTPVALELLARTADLSVDQLPEQAAAHVLSETGGVALAVALVGASLKRQPPDAWDAVVQQLRTTRATWLGHPYADIFRALTTATAALSDQQRRMYITLAVYPEDTAIPVHAIERLWRHIAGYDGRTVRQLLAELAGRDLLIFADDRVQLHDLQRDFLLLRIGDPALLHGELLDAYRGVSTGSWSTLPDNDRYIWNHLFFHLRGAGEWAELRSVGVDAAWALQRFLQRGGYAIAADLEVARRSWPEDYAVDWLDHTIRSLGHLLDRYDGRSAAATLRALIPRQAGVATANLEMRTPIWLAPRWDPTASSGPSHERSINGVAWSPDSASVVSGSQDQTARVWDAATGAARHALTGHEHAVNAVAWSPDGHLVATASSDATSRLWCATTGGAVRVLRGHTNWINAVTWSPDGIRVATASDDRTVRVWDVSTGDQTMVLADHSRAVLSVTWSPDGARLLTTSRDQTARLWDAKSGEQVGWLRPRAPWGWSVSWAPDGRRIATSSDDGLIRLWEAATGRLAGTLGSHGSAVAVVAWSPDGTRLASSSMDGSVLIWDVFAGTCVRIRTAGRPRGVAWNGNALCVSINASLMVYDVRTAS